MNWFKRLFAPKVTLQAVFRLAEASGVADFAELLRNAENAGLIDDKRAAELRAQAREDEAGAHKKLADDIAAAEARFQATMAEVSVTDLEADQAAASARETLDAVEEIKRAMGK